MSGSPPLPSVKEKPRENVPTSDSPNEGDQLPSEAAVAAARGSNVPGAGGGAAESNDATPVLRYTREELMDMRNLPLSKIRPECLNKPYKSRQTFTLDGGWDPNKKRSETPTEDDRGRADIPGDKRRPGDPRERIRKESEGIVLSPQRRSFTSGCFVVAGMAPGGGGSGQAPPPGPQLRDARLRPDSPIFSQGDGQKGDQGSRDSRRVGSGRIMSRDMAPWERGCDSTGDPTNTDFPSYHRSNNNNNSHNRDDRYERRSFGRDMYGNSDKNRDRDRDRDIGDNRFSDRRDRDDNRRSGGRYNDRRRYEKEEEPEWFSAGPTSQHETIELRGFDDPATPTSTSAPAAPTSSNTTSSSAAAVTTTTTNSAAARSTRRSAGSGRTPSAMAANLGKDAPPKISDKFDEDAESKMSASPSLMDISNKENLLAKAPEEGKDRLRTGAGGPLNALDNGADIDDILKMDVHGLIPNGGCEESLSSGSRFSQWFRREPSPPPAAPGPPPAQHQEPEHLFANILNDLQPSISIPNNDSQHLFAPISPAASTTPAPNSLLEMLRRGQQQHQQQQQQQHQQQQQQQHHQMPHHNMQQHQPMQHHQQFHHHKPNDMKVHSLEELEAHMRGPPQQPAVPQPPHPMQHHLQQQQMQHQQLLQQQQQQQRAQPFHQPPQEGEINAFRQLMAQVSGGHPAPATNGPIASKSQQPMSLLQMLNKSQQADQAALEAQQHQQASQPGLSHDLLCKLLHVQQTQQQELQATKMMGNINHSNRHFQVSPIPNDLQGFIGGLQPSPELLQRPEAIAIMNGLKAGQITPQHLMKQMSNPGMQTRHREVIGSILKMHQQSMQASSSPRACLGLPSQQQLRLSPLPPNAYCVSPIMPTSPNTLAVHHPALQQRIPSPRELQAHTQSIMQGALIKKKLEEQRENFRRRQEQTAPSPTKHQGIAFTPTSVLRKMTAEKEPDQLSMLSSGAKASGWGAPPSHTTQPILAPKHGRPIVKGNTGGMSVPAYQPTPADYPPSQYLHHQQQQQQYVNTLREREQARSKVGVSGGVGGPPGGVGGPPQPNTHQIQQQQQMSALLMRQQHQQHHPQVNNRGAPMAGGPAPNALQQLIMQSQQRNLNESGHAMGPALSPTSNQLARWFSPELLAQATAGKLPSVNLAQNALSLEELERIQHNEAIVHN